MQSRATTVSEYLLELPEDRRATVAAVRETILANLDAGFEEMMQYGMIGYAVPHRIYPAGYHCDPKQPLPFAGLASQKGHFSLYLMCLYGEGPWDASFRERWTATGRKLDMGKCCVRFKKLADVPLEVVAETFRRITAADWIATYESSIKSAADRRKRAK
jgi:hypothetical protein